MSCDIKADPAKMTLSYSDQPSLLAHTIPALSSKYGFGRTDTSAYHVCLPEAVSWSQSKSSTTPRFRLPYIMFSSFSDPKAFSFKQGHQRHHSLPPRP